MGGDWEGGDAGVASGGSSDDEDTNQQKSTVGLEAVAVDKSERVPCGRLAMQGG
jgi:hypothetical protein